MNEVKVQVEAVNGEITIRTGAALPLEPKVQVTMRGTIESVLDFAKKREAEINEKKTHVIIKRKSGCMVMVVNEDEKLDYQIEGSMVLHEYIQQLGINEGKAFTITALINLFKLNRRFFTSRDAHSALVAALMNFSAKTEIEFANSNDFKGNVAQKKIVAIKHEIPLVFEMKIPIFEGLEESSFNVEIEVYPDNGSIVSSFVSVDLAEQIDQYKKEVFAKVKEALKKYVIIQQ